jgi:hypothetical protein
MKRLRISLGAVLLALAVTPVIAHELRIGLQEDPDVLDQAIGSDTTASALGKMTQSMAAQAGFDLSLHPTEFAKIKGFVAYPDGMIRLKDVTAS